ncbi:hypothetical protein [Aquimarina addita]
MKNNIKLQPSAEKYTLDTHIESNKTVVITGNREGLKKLKKAYSLTW